MKRRSLCEEPPAPMKKKTLPSSNPRNLSNTTISTQPLLASDSSSLQPPPQIPFVILVNVENTNIIRQTQSHRNKRQRFHVVYSNVELRPPSRGIDCLIIYIMEIYNKFTHTSLFVLASTGIQKFIVIYTKN
jgi:hypothetical protein